MAEITFSPGCSRIDLNINFSGDDSGKGRFIGNAELSVNGETPDSVSSHGNSINDVWETLMAKVVATMNEQMYRTLPKEFKEQGTKVLHIVRNAQLLRKTLGTPDARTVNDLFRTILDACGLETLQVEALHVENPATRESEEITRETSRKNT